MFKELYADLERRLGNPPVPNALIHYTGHDNLINIISSRELWLGQIDQQNDRSEFVHLLDVIYDIIPELNFKMDLSSARNIINKMRYEAPPGTFTSSWCPHTRPGGQSMHWQAEYGDYGEGAAIVACTDQFRTENLSDKRIFFHLNSATVKYLEGDEAKNHVLMLVDVLRSWPLFNQIPGRDEFLLNLLMAEACSTKSPDFEGEGEFRIIGLAWLRQLTGMPFPQEDVFESKGRNYLKLRMEEYPSSDFDLRPEKIIKKILVGPRGDSEKRKAEIESALEKADLKDIPVEISSVPLV